MPLVPAYYLEISLVVLGLALLLADAFRPGPDKRWIGWIALIGLLGVFVLNFSAKGGEGQFWEFYTYAPGSFAGFYKGLALLGTMFFMLLGLEYVGVVKSYTAPKYGAGEFFVLPLFTCAGVMWAASAIDLTTIFVSIELVTISLYVMVAFLRRNVGSLEAGVKYLVLGALSTGFMVYGITWIFGATGSTSLEVITQRLASGEVNGTAALFGLVLLLVAIGFKVGAFPFSVWIPDVYQGAPTPVTAYLATGSKAAGFIVLLRVLAPFLQPGEQMADLSRQVTQIVMILAGATVLFGSLAAISQTNFKRLLAYSGVSQAGFLLLAIACAPLMPMAAGSVGAAHVVAFGLGSYLLMATLSFAAVTLVRVQTGGEELASFQGLHQRSPFLAFVVLVSMASLAGVPLTAGFISKAFVFWFAVKAHAWFLLGVAVISGAAGFYYYFKVLRSAYMQAPVEASASKIEVSPVMRVVLTGLVIAVFYFGVAPQPLFNLAPKAKVAAVESR